ncbi:hypothetical protein OC498_01570 [Acinetobacter bohemicus]|uniref:hypothetical protein n=1 Tax=Acinetobacter TaxID=469 RepID=UPI001197EF0A|nr:MULTISPECIES: hypothetical protein [Acinetobacter]MDM1780288.1 hypothetical protein [Acinetobacter indicus]MCO8041586.1 hypothetical protein [Acinetobacter sp. S4400-12]MCU7223610.1 hypothetical protein [Acinetobacter bohemicus]TSH78357.1 hypothetical protein E2K73_00065 [Acinetobacter sp. RF15A]TSI20685.1 hypothetical protein E2K74_01490 [Acinetobacter sp. RF15B]
MKRIILLSIFAISVTGCVVDPYDDGDYRYNKDRHGQYDRNHGDRHYDRKHGDRDWKHKDHRDWKHDRDNRDWRRDR